MKLSLCMFSTHMQFFQILLICGHFIPQHRIDQCREKAIFLCLLIFAGRPVAFIRFSKGSVTKNKNKKVRFPRLEEAGLKSQVHL